MTELNRIYKLTIRRAAEEIDVEGFDPSFFELQETAIEITDMRFEFKIEKNLASHPNTCELTITNLTEVTREGFVTGKVNVRFEAGYDQTLRLMFVGDVRYASNEKQGTEWLTKIQLADGGRAFAAARVNHSYAPKTPLTTILRDAARALGVALPPEIAASKELQTRLASGEQLSGYASDEMTRLLAPFGYEWSFQNGQIQILRVDEARPGSVRVISQDDGMIEAPVMDPPKIRAPAKGRRKAKPNVPKLTVKHALYPELVPGEQIEVRSRSINGRFKIDKLQHQGDTFGSDWTTTIEAVSA